MNKFFYVVIIGILLISGVNTVAISQLEKSDIKKDNNSEQTLSYTISFSYPEFTDLSQYVKVDIQEANKFLTIPEYPMLPFYSRVTTFPLGTKIINVKCIHSAPQKILLTKQIYHAPKIQWMKGHIKSDKKDCNFPMFTIDESNLEDCYSFRTGGGLDDGKHVTFFVSRFYPVRYLPDEEALLFINYAEFEVIYEEPSKPNKSKDDYSLVIIASSSFSTQLQSLVSHKNNYGLTAKIVTLEEIYNGNYFPVQGDDKAEKIKYFIKDALEQWKTSYILLVGDIYKLPIRKTWIFEWNVPTDLYYADIYFSDGSFSSWDTNGNGRYGEFWQQSDDIVDLYADVYIGRLACKNSYEVSTVVNKIIKYEQSTYGQNWFKNIILCGGDTHPQWGIYEGEVTLDEIEKCMPDFTPIKLYTSKGTFSASKLNKAMNNGAGFVVYAGHGFANGMGTHPPRDEQWISYSNYNMFGLWNINKLPIIFFDACLTAKLDFTLGDLLKLQFIQFPLTCFAWSFVKKIFGGAIATIGATRVAFGRIDEDGPKEGACYLTLKFFENFVEGSRIAEMFVSAQNEYINDIEFEPFTVQEFILLGDPSLMIGGYNG